MERKDTIRIVLLNVVVLVGIVFLLQVSQKNAADIYMEYAVSLKGGEQALFFSNYVYGNVLKGLYKLLPQVAWYGIIHYIFILISFIIITYLIVKRFSKKSGMVLSTVFLMTFGYEWYANPEYTKTALVMVISAFLLIVFSSQKKSAVGCILGGIWAVCGALINARVFFIVLALLGGFIVLWIIVEKKKNAVMAVLSLLAVMVLVSLACVADDKYYESVHSVNGIDRDSIAVLYDFGWPDYAQYGAEYAALNISEPMYLSLTEGRFSAISWSQIQSIASIKAECRSRIGQVLQKDNIIEMITASANYAMCIFGLVFLISKTKNKWGKMLCVTGVFALCIGVMYYLGAEQNSWILYTVTMVSSIAFIFGMNELDYEKIKYNLFPFLGVALYFFYLNNSLAHMGNIDWKESKEDWITQRSVNVESQYIYDLDTFVDAKPIFVSYSDLSLAKNMYIVSGLDYLNSPKAENAFSLSVLGQYNTKSYWCEEMMSIYSISHSVQAQEGYALGFIEMGRSDGAIVYSVE